MDNFFQRFPLLVANVDLDVYKHAPNKDRNIITSIGWGIIIAALMAGGSVGYFMYIMTGSKVLCVLGGFTMIVIVYFLDRTLLRDEKKMTIAFRFLISLIIAIVISMPLKVNMSEDMVKAAIVQNAMDYNQNLYDEHVGSTEKELEEKKDMLEECIRENSHKENGKIVEYQIFLECKRQKTDLESTWDEKIEKATALMNDRLITPDTSFVNQLSTFVDMTFNPSVSKQPLAWYLNFAIMLFFLITEALPTLLRTNMQNSYYIKAVSDKNNALERIQNNRRHVLHKMTHLDAIVDNEMNDIEIKYWDECAKALNADFEDTAKLREYGRKFAEMKSVDEKRKQSQKGKQNNGVFEVTATPRT